MEEKQISEIESLQIIQQMIGKAKNTFVEKGTWPIYWGTIITFCSLFQFLEVNYKKILPFNIFLITFPALVIQILVIIYTKIKNKDKPTATKRSIESINYVWIAFTVSIILISFIPKGSSFVVYLTLYGIPTFVTGGILKFRAMLYGGIVCWLCALSGLLFKIDSSTVLLLAALSATAAWLIPGIILRKKYLRMKKGKHV